LLDSAAAIDGVVGDGVPMDYAMHFGFVEVAELLGQRARSAASPRALTSHFATLFSVTLLLFWQILVP
jgi:hypothetical protein